MRVDWIEDIVALLRCGGVTEAARLRHITQPAFSRRIRALEDALSIDLIDRTVKPSGPSKALKDREKDFLRLAAELRQLTTDIRTEQDSGAQMVSIACQHAISTSFGPIVVRQLTEIGKLHVRLRSANLDECEALLTAQQVAITLTYTAQAPAEPLDASQTHLERQIIGRDRLIPVCDRDSAAAHRADLEEGRVRVVGYPANVFLGETMAAHVMPDLTQRYRVQVVTEVGLTPAALHLAQSGLGVAWIPESLAQPGLLRGDVSDLSALLPSVQLSILAHRSKAVYRKSILRAWSRLLELSEARTLDL